MSLRSHLTGVVGEQLATDYLIQKGYSVLARNYRIKGGEIDIIAQKGGDIVFVEVKLRASNRYGYPEEAVSYTKQKRVAKAIKFFLHTTRVRYSCVRFDIIAITQSASDVTIIHIENVELNQSVC